MQFEALDVVPHDLLHVFVRAVSRMKGVLADHDVAFKDQGCYFLHCAAIDGSPSSLVERGDDILEAEEISPFDRLGALLGPSHQHVDGTHACRLCAAKSDVTTTATYDCVDQVRPGVRGSRQYLFVQALRGRDWRRGVIDESVRAKLAGKEKPDR
jgi:hypothetical protein